MNEGIITNPALVASRELERRGQPHLGSNPTNGVEHGDGVVNTEVVSAHLVT